MAGKRTKRLVGGLALIAGVGLAVTFSCAHQPQAESPAQKSAKKNAPSSEEKTAQPAPLPEPETYADALRRRDFSKAGELFDASTSEEKKSPEVRYARAVVALELDDVEKALRLVNGLEEKWPPFKPEAEEIRLEAAKKSNDVTLLTHFLGSSTSLSDQLLLADARLKGGSSAEARKIIEEVLAKLKKSKRRDRKKLEARAHEIKARALLAEEKKSLAAREYRWLATDGVDLAIEIDAAEEMLKLDPAQKLSTTERLQRAESFSDSGLVKATENELAKIRAESKNPPPEWKSDALLAWAIYIERSDYEKASQLFEQAAKKGGPDRKKHLYYEAKALARSHRDADAIGKYETLAGLGSNYAEHASYQAARLRFIDGQWEAAVKGYEKYLRLYGKKATHRSAALYDLPIARLAAGQFALARKELKALFKEEDSQRVRARLMELEAVALLGEKKDAEAKALFRSVIAYRPLSLPALMAQARLKELGETPPTPIPVGTPSPPTPPLKLSLPDKVWRLSRVGLDAKAEAALKKAEPALKKQYQKRSGEALCRLYGQLQSAKRRYQVAQTAASWSNLKRAPDANTDWQWSCIYPTPYLDAVARESEVRKVPSAFVFSVMRQESAFRPTVVSPANAVGLMQIIPPTATKIADEISATYDPALMRAPAVNIRFGTYYLRRLLDMFGERPELAAASYNAGPHAVTRWLRAGETLPLDLFIARIPYRETRNYVYRVMGNYARYAYQENHEQVVEVDLALPKGLKAPEDAY